MSGITINSESIGSIIKERIDNFELQPDEAKLSVKDNIEKTCEDILNSDNKYFICGKCSSVGETNFYKNNITPEKLKQMIFNKSLECQCCITNEYIIQDKPTSDEMLIASFSPLNFISKYDHIVEEIVVEDSNAPHGYKLGKIDNLDTIKINEANMDSDDNLKMYLDKLEKQLEFKPNNKIKRLIEQPNRTTLLIELAEYKRKYKQAKKENNKQDIKHYKGLMDILKIKLNITHD